MKLCPVCGEVYSQHAKRCHAHDVPLRTWRDTSETQLAAVTDVERDSFIETPSGARLVAGELNAPWPTPEPEEMAHAETPLVQISRDLRVVPAPVRGRILGDRFRLSRQLGVGGYGAVFAAEDLATRERVAIKVLTPAAAQSAELITRFHREAIAASRVRHPHIVDVADFDVDRDGCHYIVMEYLDGSDLAEVLDATPRLSPVRALVIAAQCARGLAAAHRVGVLHRDLKPANVFLVRRPDGNEAVKIIDFGISKLTRAAGDYTDVTSASKVVGTPCYMSPEQARGRTLDARTDVYALGVMLFEMLVGQRPFTGRSPLEILGKHSDAPRVRPSEHRPELAQCPGLDALVLRAIAAAPGGRFRTMEDFLAAIVACLRALDPAAADRVSEITGELTDPSEAPTAASPATRSRRVLGVLGAVAAVVAAVVLWPAGDERARGPAVDRPPRVAPRAQAPAPTPPSEVPPAPILEVEVEPAQVAQVAKVVRLTSTPPGAVVIRDGQPIGETPLDVELVPDAASVELTLRANGHVDGRVVVDRERDAVDVVLAPRRRTPRRAPRSRGVEEW